MSLLDVMFNTGRTTLMVGVEDGPAGALKVYFSARYEGRYVLVSDPDAQEEVRRAWGSAQHVLMPTPPVDAVLADPCKGCGSTDLDKHASRLHADGCTS